MKKIILLALLLFVTALTASYAAQDRETFTLAAGGLQSLRIDCGAGYLKIQGIEGLEQIEVTAVLDVRGIDNDELAAFKKEYVRLKLEKAADRAELTAAIESHFSLESLFGHGRDARIDLDVRVPRRLALDIEDGSGSTDIRDCNGDIELEDGSGEIRMSNLGGRVEIDDGSGDMTLVKLNGRVRIEDGSGDIELEDAGSDVDIEDGSGEIRVKRVNGSLTVDDGSGDIEIDGVEKDVFISEAGSGDVDIRNVKGKVRK